MRGPFWARLLAWPMSADRSRYRERQCVDGVEIMPVEARLVGLLRESPGRAVPHATLIRRLWPHRPAAGRRDVAHLRELVYRIRQTFADETGEVPIATVLGRGYVWER